MLDPNSTVPAAHEVRVRARGVRLTPDGNPVQVSTRSDFIAPDLSPVSTHALEMDKGLAGWTRDDVRVPMSQAAAEARARQQRIKHDIDNNWDCGKASDVIRKRVTSTAVARYNPGKSKRRGK